jgi:Ser/Thr protein kinase RdoA (MazF antagonist)
MNELDADALARTLAATVAAIWPMTLPSRLTPVGAGQNSLVFRVEAPTTAPCILRVYRNHADIARVHHEMALLAALRAAPLPFAVPTPLATHAGGLVHQVRGEDGILSGALVALWRELAGAHPDPADEGQARAAGAALAQLDLALAAIDPATLPGRTTPPLKELRQRVSAPDDIEDILPRLPLPAEDTAELLRLLHLVETELPPLYIHLPQQLIHADFDQLQILMNGVWVTGIIDFEFSHYDLRIADLVVPLSLWPRDLFGTGAEWGVLDALGQGYATHLPLTQEEVQALPLLLRLRAIGGLLRDIGWQRQGRASAARVVERAVYTLGREHWLRENQSRLLAMAERWSQGSQGSQER